MTDRSRLWILVAASVFTTSSTVLAQQPPAPAPRAASEPLPIIDESIDAAQAEETRTRLFTRWNHYEGPLFSIRVGGGVLYDYAGYSQDEASEEQFPDLNGDGKLR